MYINHIETYRVQKQGSINDWLTTEIVDSVHHISVLENHNWASELTSGFW
jgi:hypothetical protein